MKKSKNDINFFIFQNLIEGIIELESLEYLILMGKNIYEQ